jgi:RNA-binding protein
MIARPFGAPLREQTGMKLTTKQIVYLRGLAQSLRPQVMVGHEGYSEGVQSALEDLFRGRELVKVRLLKTTDEGPKEVAQVMADAANAVLVGVVGRTFVLYRPNPELRERIELPVEPAPERGARTGRRPAA